MEISSCGRASREVGLALGKETKMKGRFECRGCSEVGVPSGMCEMH